MGTVGVEAIAVDEVIEPPLTLSEKSWQKPDLDSKNFYVIIN